MIFLLYRKLVLQHVFIRDSFAISILRFFIFKYS